MGKQLVVLDFWTVTSAHIPRAIAFMGLHRRTLKREPKLNFWKLLGTGSGQSFTMRDSDPRQWGLLTVWEDPSDYESFKHSLVLSQWTEIAIQSAHFELEPLSAKGVWQKQTPFEPQDVAKWSGPTAALTRARIKPQWWVSFWRSIPPVSADLNQTPGLVTSVGIGEAPIGLQGTFSVWQTNQAITEFASRRQPHQKVVERTAQTGWYAEELFARFKIQSATGTLGGVELSSALNASSGESDG